MRSRDKNSSADGSIKTCRLSSVSDQLVEYDFHEAIDERLDFETENEKRNRCLDRMQEELRTACIGSSGNVPVNMLSEICDVNLSTMYRRIERGKQELEKLMKAIEISEVNGENRSVLALYTTGWKNKDEFFIAASQYARGVGIIQGRIDIDGVMHDYFRISPEGVVSSARRTEQGAFAVTTVDVRRAK